MFQYCGWLGETSTEVSGFVDLHLLDGYDDNPIVIPVREDPSGLQPYNNVCREKKADAYYDLCGRMVRNPQHGLYIKNGKKVFVK